MTSGEREEFLKGALLLVLFALFLWQTFAALERDWTPLFWGVLVVVAVFGLRVKWARPAAYVVAGLAVIWFVAFIWQLLFPFIAAFIIAYLGSPVVAWLERRKVPRGVSAAALLLLALGLVAGALVLIVPAFIHQVTNLAGSLGAVPAQVNAWLAEVSDRLASYEISPYAQPVVDKLVLRGQEAFATLLERALGFITSLSSLATHIINIVIIPIITFYLLRDMPKIRAWVRDRVPERYHDEAITLIADADRVLAGWIRGQFILSTLEGLFIAGALSLIGVNYALLLGLFAGFANMVPYVGTYIGALPAVVVVLLGPDPTRQLLLGVPIYVGINIFDAYFLAPRIVGRRVGLHPVMVMIAMFVGAKFFGVVGFLAAVPVAGILRVVGLRLERRYLEGSYFRERPPASHRHKSEAP